MGNKINRYLILNYCCIVEKLEEDPLSEKMNSMLLSIFVQYRAFAFWGEIPLYFINTFGCIIIELTTANNTATLNHVRKVKCSWLGGFQIPFDLNPEAQW